MIRNLALILIAGFVLVSCQADRPYKPATRSEKTAFSQVRLNVYPDDVRTNLLEYTNTVVAWVGVIKSTDAFEEEGTGGIHAETVFEHHYFDWLEDCTCGGISLMLSPGGEGMFRSELHLRRTLENASAGDAEAYTGPGRLAVFYGVPQSVDPDGTIVLRYRYMRVLGVSEYTTNEIEYGRLALPFHAAGYGASHMAAR
jgi:hypothetical protein